MEWINCLSKKFFVAFSFLLTLNIGFAQNADEGDQKLKLVVHEFILDTVHSMTNGSLDVDSGLISSFGRYNEIEMLDKASYPEITIDHLHNGTMPDSLPGIDIIVFGSYVIVNEFVKIQPVIYDANEDLFHTVSFSRGTINGADVLVAAVAENIFESLTEICPLLQQSQKKIAFIADFETVSGVYKNIGPIKISAKNYTKQIMQEVEYRAPANANILSWTKLREFDGVSTVEMIKELNLDMVVQLIFVFENNQLVGLKTDFDILEKSNGKFVKREFDLPYLRKDYYSEYDFIEFVVNEYSDFLERIISPNGQWDFILFPNKTSTKPAKADLLIYKAENFAAKNDFFLSSFYYYEALNDFPEAVSDKELRLQIGFNKVYLNRLEEADEEFDFVLSQDADNGYAFLGKSLINYYNANYDEAFSYIETATQKGFDNEFLIDVMKGYYYFEMGKFEEAIPNFNAALNAEQKIIRIRIINNLEIAFIKVHVGLCYLELKRFDEAITYYKDLIKEFPYNKDLPYYLGNAYSKKGIEEYFAGNYVQAIENFDASRKTYPNNNINDYLRTSLIHEMRFEKARAFIQEEIDKGMYDAMFIWNTHAMDIRQLLIDKQKSSNASEFDQDIGNEAIKIFTKAIEFDVADPDNYYYIGEIYTLMGDNQKGLEYMEKAFEAGSMNFDIQIGLIQAYLLTNQFENCEKLSRRVSRINRKQTVNARTEALMDYLLLSASLPQDKKVKREVKNLNKLFKEEVIVDQWFYEPYLSWLESCTCSEEVKKELLNWTEKMKAHGLD